MENNKNLIIVIVVLSLLVVGLGGYIVYDKLIKVELQHETNNNQNNNGNNSDKLMIIF